MFKKLFDFAKKMFFKYRELIVYVFFGAVTTAVNFLVYILIKLFLTRVVGLPYNEESDNWIEQNLVVNIAQVVAWIAAVLVAFYTNKRYVFGEKEKYGKKALVQFVKFTSMRLGSFFFEMVSFNVMHGMLKINDLLSKAVIAVVVVILNYVFSKIFIFAKKDKPKDNIQSN